MWEVSILWIHTNCTLQVASYVWSNLTLEDIVVAFLTYNLKRTNVEHTLLAILICTDAYKFKTYSIRQALLVDNVTDSVCFTCLSSCYRNVPRSRLYINSIPTLSNSFLPLCNFLSQLVIVSRKLVETSSLLAIELIIVVIELTLHCIVRCDCCDRVLDNLNPTIAVALLVLIIIKRNNFVLKQTIDCCSIKLILIALVLICTLLGKSPTCTLAIALKPPTIKYREIYNTVHLSLLTRCTRSLKRTCWSVHPNINTRYKTTSKHKIVILKEDNLTKELRTLANLIDLLDQALTCTISRVCLTSKEELNRTLWVVNNLRKTLKVCKEKVSTLVSSKTTTETNEQSIRSNALKERYNT